MSYMFRKSTSNMAATPNTNVPRNNVGSSSGSIPAANNVETGQDVCGTRQSDVSYKNFEFSHHSKFESNLKH